MKKNLGRESNFTTPWISGRTAKAVGATAAALALTGCSLLDGSSAGAREPKNISVDCDEAASTGGGNSFASITANTNDTLWIRGHSEAPTPWEDKLLARMTNEGVEIDGTTYLAADLDVNGGVQVGQGTTGQVKIFSNDAEDINFSYICPPKPEVK